MTTVRLVVGCSIKAMVASFAGAQPAALISYAYRDPFIPTGPFPYGMRNWALDSGAFTAFSSGHAIDFAAYTAFAQDRLATDPLLVEVFALDVIDNPEGSAKNTEAMWAAGVPAIPTFHSGEPWEYLTHMAARYPKIALGGAVNLAPKTKIRWAEQCFSRVYPKRIHGLGFAGPPALMALPFHSTDASTWIVAPMKFARYRGYSDPMRHASMELSSRCGIQWGVEVQWYLRFERYLKEYWASEMALLDSLPNPTTLGTLPPVSCDSAGSGRNVGSCPPLSGASSSITVTGS